MPYFKDITLKPFVFLVITSVIFFSNQVHAQRIKYPMLLFGPGITAYSGSTLEQPDNIITLSTLRKIPDNTIIHSGASSAYILICVDQIIELTPNTKVFVNGGSKDLHMESGSLIIHANEEVEYLCYDITSDAGSVGSVSPQQIRLSLNYELVSLKRNEFVLGEFDSKPSKKELRDSFRDGQYLFEMLEMNEIPSEQFIFDFPSKRPGIVQFSTREKTGVATYKEETYYHAGSYLKFKIKEFEFVYNLWLAAGGGGFYSDNWDEWQDYVNNIHYIQLFQPSDPFFLRIGMVERLTFGRGFLLDNYNNTVILPFENLSGVQMRLQNDRNFAEILLNDITDPVIAGLIFSWKHSSRMTFNITYLGDFDQYSNILDSDDDSYPDRVDPQPDTENTAEDSVIINAGPELISMDDVKPLQLHAIGLGMKYHLFDWSNAGFYVVGDFGVLSQIGMGLSVPNLIIEHPWFELGIGGEFQSPGFEPSIFDRSYEYNKARFIKNEDDELVLTTRVKEIAELEEWNYGWNSSIKLKIPSYVTLSTKYRNVQVGDIRDRDFAFSIKSKYQFSKYLRSYGFFIEQKNFEKLFKEKTDGSIWGLQLSIQAHKSTRINLRYREQYQDKNGDGEISKGESERNVSVNLLIRVDQLFKQKKGR
jgi:hypothetical protein